MDWKPPNCYLTTILVVYLATEKFNGSDTIIVG